MSVQDDKDKYGELQDHKRQSHVVRHVWWVGSFLANLDVGWQKQKNAVLIPIEAPCLFHTMEADLCLRAIPATTLPKWRLGCCKSRFGAAMQVNQHKACGSLSHCDRTGEREENALPAIRVVLHAHLQEWQISAKIMNPLSALSSGPGSTVSYHPGSAAADEHPMGMGHLWRGTLWVSARSFWNHWPIVIWLVVWTPLKNICQLGWLFPIYGKIKNVPNHQPVIVLT